MQGTTAVVPRYIAHLNLRALAPGSTRSYRYILTAFDVWLEDRSILDATRDDVRGWLTTKNLSPRARYTYISCLHSFYEWAIREEIADRDPTIRVDRPRLPRRLPRPMSAADFHLAMRMASPRMAAWLALAGYCGLRCKEIAGVQVDDLMWSMDPPMLLVSAAKGARERTVPLNRHAETALQAAGIPRAGYLFIRGDRPRSGEPVKPRTVSELVGRHLHGLGINATAHQARHLFATVLYQQTRDLRLVQEMLGHASPATTAGYAAFSPSLAAETVRDLELVDVRVTGAAARLLHDIATR